MSINECNKNKGITVKLRINTYKRIQNLKHIGQSNDGFITELLDLYEEDLKKHEIRSIKR